MFQGLDVLDVGYAFPMYCPFQGTLCSSFQVKDGTLEIIPCDYVIEHHSLYPALFQSRFDV